MKKYRPKIVGYYVRRKGTTTGCAGRPLFATKAAAEEGVEIIAGISGLRKDLYEIITVVDPAVDPPCAPPAPPAPPVSLSPSVPLSPIRQKEQPNDNQTSEKGHR